MEGNDTGNKQLGQLGKLPRELRDEVYRSLFQGNEANGRFRVVVTSGVVEIDKKWQPVVDGLHPAYLGFDGLLKASSTIKEEALTIFAEQAILDLNTSRVVEQDDDGPRKPMEPIELEILERFKTFEVTSLFCIQHGPIAYRLGYLNLSLLTVYFRQQADANPGDIAWNINSVEWRMLQGDQAYPVRPEPVDEAREDIEGVVDLRLRHLRDLRQHYSATKNAFRQQKLTPALLEAARDSMAFSVDESLWTVGFSEYCHRSREFARAYYVQRTETIDGIDVLLEPTVYQSQALRPLTVAASVAHKYGFLLPLALLE